MSEFFLDSITAAYTHRDVVMSILYTTACRSSHHLPESDPRGVSWSNNFRTGRVSQANDFDAFQSFQIHSFIISSRLFSDWLPRRPRRLRHSTPTIPFWRRAFQFRTCTSRRKPSFPSWSKFSLITSTPKRANLPLWCRRRSTTLP